MRTFHEFMQLCVRHRNLNPEWREGQTYFNALWIHRQDLALSVYQTRLDPFYQDSVVPEFLQWLEHHWDSEQ